MTEKRPLFKKLKPALTYDSAEELFSKLPNRDPSHGYLRGPQVDALRAYNELESEPNLAFELPTGTGKTTVGLLIAEWRRRRSKDKVAFLSLTNQLARQVLVEAQKLGIECADLTGNKDTRNPAEEGRYRSGMAVGVSTYSNLFNVNPVIQASSVLIFDDSHGGARYAIDMWTVKVSASRFPDLYSNVIASLRPSMTDSQYRLVSDEAELGAVELIDAHYHRDVLRNLTALLDEITNNDGEIYYPWRLIRNKLHACMFFVSLGEIVIRPLVPPTNKHIQFNDTQQRIYMSATLEGIGDLERSYGVTGIKAIKAQHAQWGKRYIFLPGLFISEEKVTDLIYNIWNEMPIKRGLLIGPSFTAVDYYYNLISYKITQTPTKITAKNIENSIDPFIKTENSLLCLAGRYDGLDLPGDDCRLLIVAETPAAIGAMERHLRSNWQLGPLLRRLERTRLIQGMGRCTRDATDYAIILFLGQSLLDSATSPSLVEGLPEEIQKELQWGIEQSEVAREDVDNLKQMILGLLSDSQYRKAANESLEEIELVPKKGDLQSYEDSGKSEVKFSQALWAEDFPSARDFASDVADKANHPNLSGYRAWWWYLASHAAQLIGDTKAELEALRRARVTGVHSGFLQKVMLKRKEAAREYFKDVDELDTQSESIWNRIKKWGWQGPNFHNFLREMNEGLGQFSNPTQFHIGLQRLGECFGAEVLRPTGDGDPDVIWIFQDGYSYTFEAKSGKEEGGLLAKKHILQAKGHPDWLCKERSDVKKNDIKPLIVGPNGKCRDEAKPHIDELNYISPHDLVEIAKDISTSLIKMRSEFAGKDYAFVRPEFKHSILHYNLGKNFIDKMFSVSLASLQS